MSFLEEPRFPVGLAYGFISQPDYSTSIVRFSGGQETRVRQWSRPLYRYTATLGPRKTQDVEEVVEWWHAMGGQECGFRMRDCSDYKSCAMASVPSATDQPMVQITSTTWQLVKAYNKGIRQQLRDVLKPVGSSIVVAVGGVQVTAGWTLDSTTGIVTFSSAPSSPTWGGEFDVPVRFDSDFPVEIVDYQIESVSFSLVELRNP